MVRECWCGDETYIGSVWNGPCEVCATEQEDLRPADLAKEIEDTKKKLYAALGVPAQFFEAELRALEHPSVQDAVAVLYRR